MFHIKIISSFALAVLCFHGSSFGAHNAHQSRLNRRDDSGSSGNGTNVSLEPVVPPSVDQRSLDTLALDTNIILAWAGSAAGSDSKRMMKRDDGIYSSASLTFKYPTIPLDHSDLISNVACSGGSLTGTISANAYAYAKKEWADAGTILFVTSVNGCGMDYANEFFEATSITFSDGNKTFTAQGISTGPKESATHMNLQWGNVGSMNLKRAADKVDVRTLTLLLHSNRIFDAKICIMVAHSYAWLTSPDV